MTLQILAAFGGNKNQINRLKEEFSLSIKELEKEFFKLKEKDDYIIFYFIGDTTTWDSVCNEVWFEDIVPMLEDKDMSWIHYEVDPENHNVTACSFEGNDSLDTVLLDTFYVTTSIKGDFID